MRTLRDAVLNLRLNIKNDIKTRTIYERHGFSGHCVDGGKSFSKVENHFVIDL